jgi:hypothetical protein
MVLGHRLGQLWANNPKMQGIIDGLIKSPPVLLERFFDMDSVFKVWEKHKKGLGDYTDILGIIVGLGFSGVEK